jgi:hypothetical protein
MIINTLIKCLVSLIYGASLGATIATHLPISSPHYVIACYVRTIIKDEIQEMCLSNVPGEYYVWHITVNMPIPEQPSDWNFISGMEKSK